VKYGPEAARLGSKVNWNACSPMSLSKFEPGPLFGGEMEKKRPRILLAGISMSLLATYHKLLCQEFEIVGTSADGRALMATAIQLQPNVIVVDLAVPLLTDVSTRQELKKLIPQTKFLVIAEKANLDVALETLRDWSSGVLLKRTARRELLRALRELMTDKLYVSASLDQGLKGTKNRSSSTLPARALTRRQREVLRLLADGKTMKEAADILSLSMSTVAFHKYKIKRTFGLRSNVELLRLAIREKLASAE
jgi:DNA-binding NarL/FixJ family response regulator